MIDISEFPDLAPDTRVSVRIVDGELAGTEIDNVPFSAIVDLLNRKRSVAPVEVYRIIKDVAIDVENNAEWSRRIAAALSTQDLPEHRAGSTITVIDALKAAILRRGLPFDHDAERHTRAALEGTQAGPRRSRRIGGRGMTVNKIIDRFEKAVKANSYRTVSDSTEQEYEAAKAELIAALPPEPHVVGRAEIISVVRELVAAIDEKHGWHIRATLESALTTIEAPAPMKREEK